MWPFGKNIADRVNDALWQQPQLKNLGLKVTANGGIVSVNGTVPTEQYIDLIRSVAEGINGVDSVDTSGVNYTRAASASAAQAAPNAPAATVETQEEDAKIAEAIETSKIAKAVHRAIKGNGELKDDPIDVLQSGKSVILRGVVDNDHEMRLAEKIARETPGVASVDASGLRVAQGVKELAKEKDQASGDTVYTVKSGDTLSEIAQKYYGDAQEYKKIAHYNNISNPDMIQVGQKIKIPG